MKRYGKIAISLLTAILLIVAILAIKAHAAPTTHATRTFRLPFAGEAAKTIVMRDHATGYVINASTGASAVDTTWANGENAGTQDTITNDWEFSIPEIPITIKKVYFTFYDAAAAAVDKTTVPSGSPVLYDPATGDTFEDSIRMYQNAIVTIPVQATQNQ